MNNFEELAKIFEFLEIKQKVYEKKIKNIYFWKLLRFVLFRDLQIKTKLMTPLQEVSAKGLLLNLYKYTFQLPYQFIFQNVLFKRSKYTKVIIIPCVRKTVCNNKITDPYSIRAIRQYAESCTILDNTSIVDERRIPNSTSLMLYIRIANLLSKVFPYKLTDDDTRLITSINDSFLHMEIDHALKFTHIERMISQFFYLEKMLSWIFKIKKTQKLYLVCSYGLEAVISAAKKNNITVYEFQHGVIDRYHFGYDFKNWETVPYFPDYLLVFGKDWFVNVHLYKKCKLKVVGDSRHNLNSSKLCNFEHKDQIILFISQQTVYRQLLDLVMKLIDDNASYQIVYRLHPRENLSSITSYLKNKNKSYINSIKFEQNVSICESAKKIKYVIGVNSTALLEYAIYNCAVILFHDEKNVTYYSKFIKDNNVVTIKNYSDLVTALSQANQANVCGYYEKIKFKV